ncbi:hypothetical protein EEB14_45560 [Rhodococcus sp. WS4]|nr:hypothetical protein EEB14_45560 [Rhodococcus sp. WS4]
MKVKATPDGATVLGFLAAAALWIALLGPAWAYIPATPTTPAANMNFADLVALNESLSPGGLQDAFYSWGAWLFATIAAVLALVAGRSRASVGIIAAAAGLAMLVVFLLASKGEATVAMLFDALPYTRVGSVLFLIGTVLLTASGVARLVSLRTQGVAVTHQSAVPVAR